MNEEKVIFNINVETSTNSSGSSTILSCERNGGSSGSSAALPILKTQMLQTTCLTATTPDRHCKNVLGETASCTSVQVQRWCGSEWCNGNCFNPMSSACAFTIHARTALIICLTVEAAP